MPMNEEGYAEISSTRLLEVKERTGMRLSSFYTVLRRVRRPRRKREKAHYI
ncbi:hypothetical protein [Bacillus cereus]|uniref:hypothetical protein n=1 Tax=Bacillus cereus TaxID=1396 RepID=UPI0015D4DF05|nr:hypothetical protein [Bacillus cereus]